MLSSNKKKFGIFMFIIFLSIITVEGFSRAYEFISAPNCLLPKSDVFNNTDPFLSRQICSDIRMLKFVEDGVLQIKENQHFTTLNINSNGFRGPDFNNEQNSDIIRIFVVGGSVVFGTSSTSDNHTIPGFLQQYFDIKSNLNVEVINAGIPYADSFRELYIIENKLLEFNPDLIIVYDGWIDASQQRLDQQILKSKQSDFGTLKLRDLPFRTPFVIPKLLNIDLSKSDNISQFTAQDLNKNKLVGIHWKENINKICEIGKENNFKTIIAIQPLTNSGNKTLTPFEEYYVENKYTLEAYFEIVNQLNKLENCDQTIDLTKIFDDVSIPIFTSKGHTGDLGNEIIAKKLFEIMISVILEN